MVSNRPVSLAKSSNCRPSFFFHRSITPPVPGVLVLDTAWSLQPAYSLIAQFHAVEHFVQVAGPGFEPG
jgi:hypothetical protein